MTLRNRERGRGAGGRERHSVTHGGVMGVLRNENARWRLYNVLSKQWLAMKSIESIGVVIVQLLHRVI